MFLPLQRYLTFLRVPCQVDGECTKSVHNGLTPAWILLTEYFRRTLYQKLPVYYGQLNIFDVTMLPSFFLAQLVLIWR